MGLGVGEAGLPVVVGVVGGGGGGAGETEEEEQEEREEVDAFVHGRFGWSVGKMVFEESGFNGGGMFRRASTAEKTRRESKVL